MKPNVILAILLTSLLAFSGCTAADSQESTSSAPEVTTTETVTQDTSVQNTASVDTSEMFTDRDMEIGYDEETCIPITLSDDSATCDSDGVVISDSTVTITEEGTYLLSGTLNGMVAVQAADTAKIQLVLDNVEITNATGAAIYVAEADKVVITTASDSENTLSNDGEYVAIDDNNIDGAIFSKADLTLNGAGVLTVNAQAGHGVVSKDDLVLTSGTYNITAASQGLSGKDSVRIASGTYSIESGKDAIHAENTEDSSLGFLYIANGTFQLTAEGDGMSASSYLLVEDGDFTIEAGGGSANAATQSTTMKFTPGGQIETTDAEDTTPSTKGIKAVTALTLQGGSYSLDTADDGLHSNGDVTITGGDFTIASGDDGIHGDQAVTVSDGTIQITQSYEGIEGLSIDITGGTISLVASDDGLNAAGGTDSSGFGGRGGDMFAATEGAYISISGGTMHIDASGDGIDSNGSLTVSGGETYVSGPTDSGNSCLDYASGATISGGIFLASGSSGMAQNFDDTSTQGVMMVTVDSASAGSTVSLTDSSGAELASWQPEKDFNSVIISCPEITEGSTYTLTVNGTSTEITMDSLVYGSGSTMGGPSGGRGGSMGGPGGTPGEAPNGSWESGDGTETPGEPPEMPEGDTGIPQDFGEPPAAPDGTEGGSLQISGSDSQSV